MNTVRASFGTVAPRLDGLTRQRRMHILHHTKRQLMKTTQSHKPAYVSFFLGLATMKVISPDESGFMTVILGVYMAMCYMSAFYIPWKDISSWKTLLKHIFIVLGISLVTTFGVSCFTEVSAAIGLSITFASILLGAAMNRKHLLPELPYIALAFWVLSLCNLPFNGYFWEAWIFSLFVIWPCMWLAVGIVMAINNTKCGSHAIREEEQ